MAKRAKKTTQASKKPAAKKASEPKKEGTIRVQLRTERLVEEEDQKGRRQVVPCPWGHTLKHDGKVYGAGDVVELPAEKAEMMLAAGQVVLEGEAMTPFDPHNVGKRDAVLLEGAVKREDVIGKIPVYEPSKGNKGDWEDYDEDIDDDD